MIRSSSFESTLILAAERPQLLGFDATEIYPAHQLGHDALTVLADPTQNTHYRIAVHAGDPLNPMDASALDESSDDGGPFVAKRKLPTRPSFRGPKAVS